MTFIEKNSKGLLCMREKIHCAIIGCGVIAPVHADSYHLCDNVELSWACDIVKDNAIQFAKRYGITQVDTDYHKILEDPLVDCVSVCTDHGSHAVIVNDAFRAGKHVLCEKALSTTPENLTGMLKTHKEHPSITFVAVFQHKFDASFRLLKELIDTNVFGKVLTINCHHHFFRREDYYKTDAWRGTIAGEGGAACINQAIHFIDVVNWVSGGFSDVCGFCDNKTHGTTIETEDTAVAAIKFTSGAMGTLALSSSCNLNWDHRISVFGTAGSLEPRDSQLHFISFADKTTEKSISDRYKDIVEQKKISSGKDYYGLSHSAQIADFIDAVRLGQTPFVTGESAAATVRFVFDLYRSSREKRWISLT
jgi:predicted dehydrogenase